MNEKDLVILNVRADVILINRQKYINNKGPTCARIALMAGFWIKIKAKQNKRHTDIKSQMIYADTITHILGSDFRSH